MKTVQQTTNRITQRCQSIKLALRQKSKALCDLQTSLQFAMRPDCDAKVIQVCTGRASAMALRDVRGNRDCRTTQLGCNPVELGWRERARRPIAALDQVHSLLPRFQILVSKFSSHEDASCRRRASSKTGLCWVDHGRRLKFLPRHSSIGDQSRRMSAFVAAP